MKKIAVVLASLLIVACASSPKTSSPQASQSGETGSPVATTVNSYPAEGSSVGVADAEASRPAGSLESRKKMLQKESVYFEFDRYEIKPEYREIILQQAEFLKQHGNDIVEVEGNADERGSNEYNLALGDERAKAVRKNLELLGIPATQIKVVSFGDQKPRLVCHEEKCWHENRRVDFVHHIS